jgi:hypothetical protein
MAPSQLGSSEHDNKIDHNADHGLSTLSRHLSLSSKTIHADDYLNRGTDVAPPLHVSTTFRYNRDPDALQALTELDVSIFTLPLFAADQLIFEAKCSI